MKSPPYLHVAFLLTCFTLSQRLQGAQTWVYEAGAPAIGADGTNQWISGVPGGFCPVTGMDGTIYVARNLNFTLAHGVLLSAVTPAL